MQFFSKLFSHDATQVGDSSTVSATDYKARFVSTNTAHKLVDVRSPAEFASGHLLGALNIPLPDLTEQLERIPHDVPVMLYCRTGNRSGQALKILQAAGYTNSYNIGGLAELTAQGLPVQTDGVVKSI